MPIDFAAPRGCSGGELVRCLRERGIEAWGFDMCPDLASIALPESAPFLRRGALEQNPFGPEDGFDTFVSFDVFEHLPEESVPQMVREIGRLGVRTLIVLIADMEFQCPGHLTLRPRHWWDAALQPTFARVPAKGGSVLLERDAAPFAARTLRVYQRVAKPVELSVPRRAAPLTAR